MSNYSNTIGSTDPKLSNINIASICGGEEAIPPSAQVIEAIDAMTDTSTPTQEETDRITATLFPPNWFKANPNYQEYIPLAKEPVSSEIIQRQTDAIVN